MHSMNRSKSARRRVLQVSAVAAGLLLAVTACAPSGGTSSSSGSKKPFRVVAIWGETGPIAAIGEGAALGLKEAARELNKTGGIDGRKVEVTTLDDATDPTQAVTLLRGQLQNPPDLIWLGDSSAEALAMVPITTNAKILTIANGVDPALNDPAKYPYHFGAWLEPTAEDLSVIPELKRLHVKKLSVIVDNQATGDSKLAGIEYAAKKAGVKIVDVERYDINAVDYTVQYQRALAANPDAVFADPGGGDPAVRIFNARLTAGGMSVPLIGGSGFIGTEPATSAPAAALANCTMSAWSWQKQGGTGQKKLASLLKVLPAGSVLTYPVMSYEGLMTVAQGLKGSNATTAPEMAKALEKANLKGFNVMFPDLDFTATNHFASSNSEYYTNCSAKPNAAGFWPAYKAGK